MKIRRVFVLVCGRGVVVVVVVLVAGVVFGWLAGC